MRIAACALLLMLFAGCEPAAPEPSPPPSTAILTETRAGAPLDEMLQQLELALVRAMTGRMEGEAINHFQRAEAITDRLLEANLPFEWISADQYSLQARLRQIQSEADRVTARWKTGVPQDQMLEDLRHLRLEVIRLRQAIARGGGRAPPPLQQLLLMDTVRARPPAARPAAPPTTPARPDTSVSPPHREP